MNIAVVTGGAGFIGSHVVDLLLAEGYRVHVVDNLVGGRLQNLDQHKDDSNLVVEVRDIREIEANDALFNDAQYVFHFAGIGDVVPSIERPVDYLSTNIMGTVRVLEGARFAGARKLVYAASSSCYGIADVPTREDAPIRPQYAYALSKYMGEEAVLHWGKVYKLPVNSVRIFNAYGTRSRTSGAYGAVFGVFLAQKLAGKPFTIVGDGTQRRDFLFVTDVAQAFYLAARTERTNEIYNLGAGDPQPVNRLVELLGGGEVVHLPKRPGEPDCTWADIAKIRRELAWKPRVSLAEGVARMVGEIDYLRQAPVWDKQSIAEATAQWFKYLRN